MSKTKGIGTFAAITTALVLEFTGLHVSTISREVRRFDLNIILYFSGYFIDTTIFISFDSFASPALAEISSH
jgi:hypothetical protein